MGEEEQPGPERKEPDPLEQLRGELRASEARAQELTSRLKYLQAEVENTRKQAERDRVEYVKYATGGLAMDLLPILDQFDLALKAATAADGSVLAGFRMVRDNLMKVLRDEGLEEIPVDGSFDPYLHEAVATVEDAERGEGEIAEVVLKGYRFASQVLRPAQVVVVRHPAAPAPTEEVHEDEE